MREDKFIINQPVSFEETLYYELKEIRGKNPVQSITNVVDEYVVAYLNSEGGSIYWGIKDSDRTVVGVNLDFRQRDEVRKGIVNKLVNIQPPITPTAYQINLHGIFDNLLSDEPISDLFVVAVKTPHTSTDELYFTGGNEAFVKTIAGKKKLTGPELLDEILRRLKNKILTKESNKASVYDDAIGFLPVLKRAKLVSNVIRGAQILWVDDNPGNNIYERMVLKSLNIIVDVATSTDEALLMLSMNNYDVVVSDMKREGDDKAGLRLLNEMRKQGIPTQVIFYIFQLDENVGTPAKAFGITSYPDDLIHYILDILERERIG